MNQPTTPEGLSTTLARIEAFNHGLATDGIKAERSVIDAAKGIVIDAPDDWRLPQLCLSDDGEIGLDWYGPGGEIHMAIDLEVVAWIAIGPDRGLADGGVFDLGAPIPEPVILLMHAIYSTEPRA
ncbi:MAG: hypothetical protein IPK85_02010 [Gemmatimonadetes bacterium]|nr:hypothetical protein [Gemmatimonadota bacterium]